MENCVTCLTDSPDVHVVSLPHLRPQLKVDAVHLVGRSELITCVISTLAVCWVSFDIHSVVSGQLAC